MWTITIDYLYSNTLPMKAALLLNVSLPLRDVKWLTALKSAGVLFEHYLLQQYAVLRNGADLVNLAHFGHKNRKRGIPFFVWTGKG